MASGPPAADTEEALENAIGEPVEREGHETLLPSVTRSALSKKSIAPPIGNPLPAGANPLPLLPPSGPLTPVPFASPPGERPRGARSGDVIGGRYIVEGQLGRGGMGRVMRVRHAALGKAFALKLIKSAIATDARIRELFYREARLASALTHDNICSIVDFGQDDQFGLFMVMELLEGQTVNARIRHNGRFAAKVACDVMWQVSDATRFIHSRQIIHGDIKSDNMFMVRTPAQRRLIKLLDFGLSRADLGQADGLDGTPEYLAPERIAGAPASQASDVYALGIVFFELLTGKLPFTGTLDDVLRMQVERPCPPPSQHCDGEPLDDRADQIVARATAKNPADRHPDTAAFMYELRTLMSMLGMEQASTHRRRTVPVLEAPRERRVDDHRARAAGGEVFSSVPIPMASCDPTGKVRVANAAFLEFLGVAGSAAGLELRDSALPEVYPSLLSDLAEVAATRRTIKRVIYLNEGDRVVEAAAVLSAAPAAAENTAGEIYVVLHPLRALTT